MQELHTNQNVILEQPINTLLKEARTKLFYANYLKAYDCLVNALKNIQQLKKNNYDYVDLLLREMAEITLQLIDGFEQECKNKDIAR